MSSSTVLPAAPGLATEPAGGHTTELSTEELLGLAMQLHRQGRLDGAQKCYETLLQLEPEHANAMHFLGVLQFQRGQRQAALTRMQRSLVLDPGVASWYNNQGNVLLSLEQFEAAAQSYARCAELDPGNVEVLNNLGVLYRRMGQPLQAEEVLKKAIALSPGSVDARNNLSTVYVGLRRFEEAFSHFADALALSPNSSVTHRLLTVCYGKAGRLEEGLVSCRRWLALEPENPEARHFYAAYGGAPAPERASDAYVQSEFDAFANSFDAKLAALQYRAPQLVGAALARALGAPQAGLQILDAGCGTGLCAPHLRPYAQQLVGVDLSANMLRLAAERGGYDELEQEELVAYLRRRAAAFDAVVSADTLCYFGRLEAAFGAVRQALRAGGHWVFTVEGHEEERDFKLHTHGRYSHARSYLARALGEAGFAVLELAPVVLRMEAGVPVAGWLVSARI